MGQSISRLVGIDQLNGRANEQFKMSRHILVTGGATVPFKELLLEAITPEFLAALKAHGFAHLHIQCGDYLDEMRKKTKEIGNVDGPEIDTFGSHPDLKALMEILCRGEAGVKSAGVVVGHAGKLNTHPCSTSQARVFPPIDTIAKLPNQKYHN